MIQERRKKTPAAEASGKRFGMLLVLAVIKGRTPVAVCVCDCGKLHRAAVTHLRSGRIISCGCYKLAHLADVGKRAYKHGQSNSYEYHVWQGIKDRCLNSRNASYPRYGGRGITVYAAWQNDFAAFLAYVGFAPPGRELDRTDNNGNYEPGNVRWATRVEQARNKSTNRIFTHKGQTRTLAEWVQITGIGSATILTRINRNGWSVADALSIHPSPSSSVRHASRLALLQEAAD